MKFEYLINIAKKNHSSMNYIMKTRHLSSVAKDNKMCLTKKKKSKKKSKVAPFAYYEITA